MENQGPENNVNVPVAPVVLPSTPPSPQKSNNVLLVLLSVLLVISVSAAGYFYYQLQKVNDDLKTLNDELKQKETQSLTQNSKSMAADETANWRNISRDKWTFKVPKNMNYLECTSYNLLMVGTPSNQIGGWFDKDQTIECNFDQAGELLSVFRGLDNTQNNIIVPTNTDPKVDPVVSEVKSIVVDGRSGVFQKETTSFGQGTGSRYKVYIHNKDYTDVITFSDISQKGLFDQILSTFKFAN